ncbi:MAG TPA: NlpC/P60 family protein [Terriglobales bacterium]|nr:NlpC/P60 family protein [Terriglobales bacterium]
MRAKLAVTVLTCGMGLCHTWAHGKPAAATQGNGAQERHQQQNTELSSDDRLSVLAAALDSRIRRHAGGDCSHLVHAIYGQAGFPYAYAPSSDLYAGVDQFRRVEQPKPGDLIVWRGHAGIVVKPSQHLFYSFLRSGPGVDDYEAPYWKRRGHPRFYRYIKGDSCARCTRAGGSTKLVKVTR